MKVYIVVYSNHFIEEWEIEGVYLDKGMAESYLAVLQAKKGDVWNRYNVEEWEAK